MDESGRNATVLVVRSAGEPVRVVELTDKPFTMGRAEGNDLQIQNRFVSRSHARVRLDAGGYVVEDMGSKNGTFVNGDSVGPSPRQLLNGDRITLGIATTEVEFRSSDTTITILNLGPSPSKGLFVDEVSRHVWTDGIRLEPPLPPKEFDLLCLLWRNRGKACRRELIIQNVWTERPHGDVSSDEIGQIVHRLRNRIEPDPTNPVYLQTIRGYGYRLSFPGSDQ